MRAVIIAALERELRDFVHGWPRLTVTQNGRTLRGYLHRDIVALASGIGYQAAGFAAQAAVAQYKPGAIFSAGIAGALAPNLKIASIVTPSTIFDARTGAKYRCDNGSGTLVTASEVAGRESKRILAEKFHAECVDMEAAAVAAVAQQERIAFRCVKAISDEVDSALPPLNEFVDTNGVFQTGKFVAWVAIRPQYWRPTMLLARNSRKACKALCGWLSRHLGNNYDAETIAELRGGSGSQPSKALK